MARQALSCAKEWPRTPAPFHAFSQIIVTFQMLQSKVAYIHPGEAGGGWGSPRVDSETDLLRPKKAAQPKCCPAPIFHGTQSEKPLPTIFRLANIQFPPSEGKLGEKVNI